MKKMNEEVINSKLSEIVEQYKIYKYCEPHIERYMNAHRDARRIFDYNLIHVPNKNMIYVVIQPSCDKVAFIKLVYPEKIVEMQIDKKIHDSHENENENEKRSSEA